jgi:AraC-like DNA-binding protein
MAFPNVGTDVSVTAYRLGANDHRPHAMKIATGESGVIARSYLRGKQIGLHMHRDAQLLFSASGIMQVTTPKGRWLVPPDRAVWLPPRLAHAVDVLADIEMRALLISPDEFTHHPDAPKLNREFVVAVTPLLREVILRLFADGQHSRRRDLLAELALFELAAAEDAATFVPLPQDPRARRVADLVLTAPGALLEMEELAREAGASARTISRLFPIETSLTFKEWRQRARIMAAVEMLGTGHPSIKQVASHLGFSSTAAFGHAFRQIMGVPPSRMLRKPA